METGARNSVVAYFAALKNLSGKPDESGIPTVCPRDLAEGLLGSAARWEAVCRRAAKLLSTHEASAGREDPLDAVAEAEECARDISRELDLLGERGQDGREPRP